MTKINIDDATQRINELVDLCISKNRIFKISSSRGDVILLSERKYKAMFESLNLKLRSVKKDIKTATETPTSSFSKTAPWDC